MARSHEADMVAALRRREWVSFTEVLARAARDGKWCLFDLLSRRLTTHLVAHLQHRFGWRTEAPAPRQIALEAFWPIKGHMNGRPHTLA